MNSMRKILLVRREIEKIEREKMSVMISMVSKNRMSIMMRRVVVEICM